MNVQALGGRVRGNFSGERVQVMEGGHGHFQAMERVFRRAAGLMGPQHQDAALDACMTQCDGLVQHGHGEQPVAQSRQESARRNHAVPVGVGLEHDHDAPRPVRGQQAVVVALQAGKVDHGAGVAHRGTGS